MRRAAKRDSNEEAIVAAIRKEGWRVMRLNEFDLLATCGNGCHLVMMEVKTTTGKLKPSQQKLIDAGWPLIVVRSPEDALKELGYE